MTLPPCPYVLEDSGYWLCGQDRTPPQLVKASGGADLPDPASEQNPGNTSKEEKKGLIIVTVYSLGGPLT